ncbi:hypothetical protein NLM16_27600 [Bradyrhizobium brasilense]|uniref:hypothetical protein n=1 Tax=Bradyrhizobium brasilense TaxID=1419277 RepID=UPI002877FBF7|nr:hypothetical protein [Bradyrhizobium brasilense]MCP3417878.1 hypothetical protein [Bradyrhizobium brasilense]
MAAHAAVNIVMALIAAARAGVHTWRARGNPEAYRRGFRGERSAQSVALALAGTPDVPASQMTRFLLTVLAIAATFLFAAHTGLRALLHLRSSSNDKVDAYEAVVRSNANTAYCYTREVANFVACVFQLVSHDALLTLPGFAASSIEYGFNSLVQQRVSGGIDQGRDFDLRWPAISAAAEAVDVAFTSGAARLAEPDMPVEIWRRRLAEGASAGGQPPSKPSVIDAIDRVTQRAVGRQLVGELSKVLPQEWHYPWIEPVLAAGTHLRELTWQAEHASRGSGVSTAVSDPEAPLSVVMVPNAGSSPGPSALLQEGSEQASPVFAAGTHLGELMGQAEDASRGSDVSTAASDPEASRPVVMAPNAGSSSGSSALLQEGGELPSPEDLNVPPLNVAPPSSTEAASSFVDRSLEEFGHLVGLGWEHSRQPPPPSLIGALNRRGGLPRTPLESKNVRIHGQIYAICLEPGSVAPTIGNPLGGNFMLVPDLGLNPRGRAGGAHR